VFSLKHAWVVPLSFCFFLISSSLSFASDKPPVPVILIHGLNGDETTWQDFGDNYLVKQNGWSFGGCPFFDTILRRVVNYCPYTLSLSQGDFYRIRFSSNESLTFYEQAKELQAAIVAVLAANPGQEKVILVAHSMGGLAARSYLQQLTPSANNVLKLITVGTPHSGADVADFCQRSGICGAPGIVDPSSVAVAELNPSSSSIQTLNDLIHHPLPPQISYTSIIGIGVGALILGDGNGIVSKSSQDLGNVLKNNGILHLHHTAISIFIPPCFDPFEVHKRCETGDKDVQDEILNQVYQCDTINSDTGMPSGFESIYGAPYDVFSLQRALLLKASCTSSSTTADVGPATYVYNQGYTLVNNNWQQTTFTCTGGALFDNAWCPQSARGTLPNNATYYIAFTCNWTGTKWNCGCKDQPFQLDPCTPNAWQIQGIQH
jgi:triacylglycerol lipase